MPKGAQDYLTLAEQYARNLSPEERAQRVHNARKSNVTAEFAPEVADMLFRGTADAGTSESEHQPSAFGGATFAYA